MQKKVLFSVLIGLIFVNGLVFSQFNISKPDAVGGSIVATNQDRSTTSATSVGAGPGIEFFLKYNLNPKVFLTAGTGISTITDKIFTMDKFKSTLLPLVEVKVGYKFNPATQISPIVYAGVSAFGFQNKVKIDNPVTGTSTTFTSDRYYDAAPFVGGGIEVAVNEKTTFHLTGDYRMIVTSKSSPKPKLWVAKAGISYALTEKKNNIYRDEIEYPLGDNEVASLDDLFMDNSSSTSNSSSQNDADALALLFNSEEASSESSMSPTEFSSTSDQNLFLQDTKDLRNTVETKSDAIKELENRVSATERALSELNTKVSTEYVGSAGGPPVDEATYSRNYQSALNQFYNKNYPAAIQQFQNLLSTNPNHQLASNCQYWIGECYNQQKRYSDAITAFNRVMQYGSSYKFDDALIMSGIVYMKIGDKQTAKQQFQELVSRYPKSEYAPKAMRYLGSL